MFVDEPHVKYGENYIFHPLSTSIMLGPKGENKQTTSTTPIWLDTSRHIFGFDSFDSQHSIEAPAPLMFAPQVDKKGRVKDRSWKSVQKMMTDPGKFLLTLKADVDLSWAHFDG